jgi:hypothetical protein
MIGLMVKRAVRFGAAFVGLLVLNWLVVVVAATLGDLIFESEGDWWGGGFGAGLLLVTCFIVASGVVLSIRERRSKR